MNIEHCMLQTLKLNDKTAMSLNILLMEGNPLKCDCDSIWLWNIIQTNGKKSSSSSRTKAIRNRGWNLPRCATPFSVKNNKLRNLKGNITIICTVPYICIKLAYKHLSIIYGEQLIMISIFQNQISATLH